MLTTTEPVLPELMQLPDASLPAAAPLTLPLSARRTAAGHSQVVGGRTFPF